MSALDFVHILAAIERDLKTNVLPFWMTRTWDEVNGGFYGALTNDLRVQNDAPRSAVLYGRILWTFAAAYRLFHDPAYLATAQRAYAYLLQYFWDAEHEGVYWSVDQHGRPMDDRKHSYAQAFALYGLSEYYRATGEAESLRRAQRLFQLLEAHAHDSAHGGYVEGCSRAWGALADLRLSEKEPNCRKSMNTLLHVMEAYTTLLRVWDDDTLKARHRRLIDIVLRQVIDPRTHSFQLFFDDDWRVLTEHAHLSPGHDIEGSWLLVEAAEVLGDEGLLAEARIEAVKMAQAVYERGRDTDGAIVAAISAQGTQFDRHWWGQAEGVVGFYNAYQLSGQARFAEAAAQCWDVIERQFIDRAHGEWFKVVDRAGLPRPGQVKIGPWECPYHNGRLGFEMLNRLAHSSPETL